VNVRSPVEMTVAALVILVGLLIGGMFALLTRAPNQQTQRVTVATANSAQHGPHRTPSAAPRTPAAVAVATPATVTTAAPTATPEPTATPTPKPTATPSRTATPAPAPAAAAAGAAPRAGSWRIEEANVQVGTIVWSGAGTPASGSNTIVLDVHKETVAGHAVSACERRTTLHAVLTAAGSPQTVPYREVNCSGAVSTGEMRVTSVSGGGAFSGSFWSNGSKLGDFTALQTR
jgi:hypothetical protein